jgi:hypothetical protein
MTKESVNGGRMKTRQVIGVIIMLSGAVCFSLESADKSQRIGRFDALGILIVLFELWVGKFNFKKTRL